MAAKTISAGTMGLRFMQKAQVSQQSNDAEKSKVPATGDGQWEIDPEVRDAWATVATSSAQSISHEASYLPFLFSSESSSEVDQTPKGRRVFNKHGVEETPQATAEPEATPHTTPDSKASTRLKVHPRPKSISVRSPALFGFPQKQESKPAKNGKTAKQAIYDNSGVGDDLRKTKQYPSDSSSEPKYLKPAGVDEPPDTKPVVSNPTLDTNSNSNLILGARSKKGKRKHPNPQSLDESAKRKKVQPLDRSSDPVQPVRIDEPAPIFSNYRINDTCVQNT